MTHNFSYFPGCSMEGVGRAYAQSLAWVNRALNINFLELEDWNCCGATAGHSVSPKLGLALPGRNLDLAEQQFPTCSLVTACASCYSRMKCAALERKNSLEILNLLEVYGKPEIKEGIRASIRRPLTELQVACYYGCLYSRPSQITGAEDGENPQNMDDLLRLTGAVTVDWAFKTECCGAAKHIDEPRACQPLLQRIYRNALANGAQALVTACPMCKMNLELRQKTVSKAYGESFALPVYYVTEVLAMALGWEKGALSWPK